MLGTNKFILLAILHGTKSCGVAGLITDFSEMRSSIVGIRTNKSYLPLSSYVYSENIKSNLYF